VSDEILLGDEAVALGAIHAGLSAAYAYPGTPATEITEYLRVYSRSHDGPLAEWCANEKTAYEAGLGVSFAGRRSLVSMKHVGLNVAADPFVNSALVPIHGGLVLAVADDPGMHSSQNEQDSRFYADFAKVLCLEPANQQEAYDMTREAFDLSERFGVPVVLRLVTRLAHSRAVVHCREPMEMSSLGKTPDSSSWILLPANARRGWERLLANQESFRQYAQACPHNSLDLGPDDRTLEVITTGVTRNYLEEIKNELGLQAAHLHIGAYPLPLEKIRRLAEAVPAILLLEEGYPFVERQFRGLLPTPLDIRGKESGHLPIAGELGPDIVRAAFGTSGPPGPAGPSGPTEPEVPRITIPPRPPRLCKGCPHADSYDAIKKCLASFDDAIVTADIGCYTLGALRPYSAIESCVCMGASIGMARGAADAGFRPVIGVIGDSTFLHSGITALLDAAASGTDMTVIILDNGTIGMTGGQPTIAPASTLEKIVLAVGVGPEHLQVVEAHPRKTDEIATVLRREINHQGLSVVIARRECIEAAKKRKRIAR
jgi:indolepyruvate ferredoxin oxidoreductase alpha subunit